MKLKAIIKLIENDYRGQHTAPTKDDAPLYDLTKNGVYPDDVYSSNAIRYYGTGIADSETYSIIRSCKDKPNTTVTIYRAMPNLDGGSGNKIKDLTTLIQYVSDFNFPPPAHKKIKKYDSEFFDEERDKYGYGGEFTDVKKYLDYLYFKRHELQNNSTPKSQINAGDWVTLTKKYAKEHSEGEKNWIIVSKKVKASELFTDGNSWDEWGYQP